jgi:hypothetical protein
MRITKRKMFLLLNGTIAVALCLYFGFWILSPKVIGEIQHPLQNSTTMIVKYTVDKEQYTNTILRNGISFLETKVLLCYSKSNPAKCRIYSYMGLFAEPLAWWLVFFLASSILLLTNNSVYSKGTVFIVQKKRPFIYMEEYFPDAFRRYGHRKRGSQTSKEEEQKRLD